MFHIIKSYFSQPEPEVKSVPADEESLFFLEKICYLLRGTTYKNTPEQLEIEDLVHGVYRNLEERELRVLLASYHPSFRELYAVLNDKPFHNCELDPEVRDDVILFIKLFGEDAEKYFYENGTKFPVLFQSVDEIIALQKFNTHLKTKKRAE